MLNELRPDVLNPPAIVVQAFDEARAIEDIKHNLQLRDKAKGEFSDAILAVGLKLIEARRAMPGAAMTWGRETYSPAFLAFIERCGLAKGTAMGYMTFARDPKKLVAHRLRGKQKVGASRRKVLKELLAAYKNGYTPAQIFAAIEEELDNEAK